MENRKRKGIRVRVPATGFEETTQVRRIEEETMRLSVKRNELIIIARPRFLVESKMRYSQFEKVQKTSEPIL